MAMNRSGGLRQQLLVWGLLLAIWGLLFLASASQLLYTHSVTDPTFGWPQALSISFGDWFPWLVLGPATAWLASHFPLERKKFRLSIPIHVIGCALAVLLCALIPRPSGAGPGVPPARPRPSLPGVPPPGEMDLRPPPPGPEGQPGPLPRGAPPRPPPPVRPTLFLRAATQARVNVPVYWIIVSIVHALTYYRRSQERERKALELEHRLTDAKLQALRMQLHPHFLFNTLNAISTLVHKDPRAADEMIANLSELLRAALDATEQEIPLCQELNFLDRYLEIQQARFGKRLTLEKEIDSASLEALVPTLILQPLVENAIRHGIEPNPAPGTIKVAARTGNGTLRLLVRDNGLAKKTPAENQGGVGLANTKARLETLYGHQARLTTTSPSEGGFTVELEIPLHDKRLG